MSWYEEGSPPLVVELYTAAGAPRDTLARPQALLVEAQWNAVGQATLTVDADDPQADVLVTPGARVVIWYRYDPTDRTKRMYLLGGRVAEATLEGDLGERYRTFVVEDDFVLFSDLTGWPNPAGTILQQGDEDAYDTRTGPAETVLKAFVTANLAHYPALIPISVPASTGKGGTITGSLRFHPLYERLWPAVSNANLTVQVQQQGTSLVVLCSTPTVYPDVLTEASGVVSPGSSIKLTEPTVTRAIVLGQGEGTARTAVLVTPGGTKNTRTPLETQWGVIREVTIDARDINDTPTLTARGQAAIDEGAPKAEGKVVLAESEDFRFGLTFNLGDKVTVQLNGQPAVTDRVRSVAVEWSARDGLTVQPSIGEAEADDFTTLGKALRNLITTTRNLLLR